jgi:hypothetical protein
VRYSAWRRHTSPDFEHRPFADEVLLHPFFWTPATRLSFLCEASDRFEIMDREPPEVALMDLECRAMDVVGADWLKRIDRSLVENLGKYRKYDGSSVRDLLRVIRNKVRFSKSLIRRLTVRHSDIISWTCRKPCARTWVRRRTTFSRTSRSASRFCSCTSGPPSKTMRGTTANSHLTIGHRNDHTSKIGGCRQICNTRSGFGIARLVSRCLPCDAVPR